MTRYEALFILDIAGKDDVLKSALDRIQQEIKTAGGKVESVQKMDFKSFARSVRKHVGGFYVNVVFQSPAAALEKLRGRFKLDEQIFRVQLTRAEETIPRGKERHGKSE